MARPLAWSCSAQTRQELNKVGRRDSRAWGRVARKASAAAGEAMLPRASMAADAISGLRSFAREISVLTLRVSRNLPRERMTPALGEPVSLLRLARKTLSA